jgi:hypothetical protein
MKKLLLSLVFLMVSAAASTASVIVLEGNYQGKNLYVQNPFTGSGVGFCVYEVRVNDQVTTDEIASSAFEVDFKNFQLKIGDKVEVKIMHKEDCKPKVLNPEALKPKSTYEMIKMTVDPDGTVKWQTKSESGKLPFVIEQFKWNKWVKVGEVEGKGTNGPNDYSFKIVPHSGKNQIRVKQTDYTNQPRPSKPVDMNSTVPELSFSPARADKKITFHEAGNIGKTVETQYEIYDQYGNVVKKGFGSEVDVSNLARGVYYLNFDNKMTEFIKR